MDRGWKRKVQCTLEKKKEKMRKPTSWHESIKETDLVLSQCCVEKGSGHQATSLSLLRDNSHAGMNEARELCSWNKVLDSPPLTPATLYQCLGSPQLHSRVGKNCAGGWGFGRAGAHPLVVQGEQTSVGSAGRSLLILVFRSFVFCFCGTCTSQARALSTEPHLAFKSFSVYWWTQARELFMQIPPGQLPRDRRAIGSTACCPSPWWPSDLLAARCSQAHTYRKLQLFSDG
jgi:hypothetical protein